MAQTLPAPVFDPAKEKEAFHNALAGLGAEEGEEDLGFLDLFKKTDFTRTLSSGMSGDDVQKVQKKLAALGYSVPSSGTYGSSTESAVREFQKDQDLKVTGKVDASTWDLLMKKAGGAQAFSSFTDALSFTSAAAPGVISAIQGPQEEVLYEEVAEVDEGPNWLLIGGLAVGGIVLVGGLAWLVSR